MSEGDTSRPSAGRTPYVPGLSLFHHFAHANCPLRETLERTGLAREISAESFYPSVHDCVAAVQNHFGKSL
jgi:hypothetical protein